MDFPAYFLILLAALFTSIVISFVSMPTIIKIASLKKLMDEPDEDRKRHSETIPTLGGIGIFAAFLISFSIWGSAGSLESYPFFVAALFMLFLVGVKDDILVLSPMKKLLIQIFVGLEIVFAGGVMITSFGGVLGLYQTPWIIGALISVIIFVAVINAFNLIDGIDGLAAGVGLIVSFVLGSWFLFSGFNTLAILAFVLMGSLMGFMVFNFHPAKIFMGDTGAMAVGFILAYLVIQFILLNQANTASEFYINNAPVFALALLIIPVVDTLRVTVLRLIAGNNPFKADYNHVHHQFINDGIAANFASPILWLGNIWVITLAYYLDYLNPNTLLVIVLIAGFLILPFSKFVYSQLLKYIPASYVKMISNSR